MLSRSLQCALEREVVGQARAIHTLVRAMTIAMSGLGNPRAPLGIYLLIGPSGTGKTHTARSVARILHRDPDRLATADCMQIGGGGEWAALTRQIAPYFRQAPTDRGKGLARMAPHSILLVEHLEVAKTEVVRALVAALETGHLVLPDGTCGSLSGCLVLMTSNLCAREIFGEDRQVGFSSAAGDLEESEKARIYQLCSSAAEKQWGTDLLGHLDDLIVFHRLHESHLPEILRRLFRELNRRLASREISCEPEDAAMDYLIRRAGRFMHLGAWFLVKVFRRFVLFPIADLASSNRVRRGARIAISLEPGDRLRFSVNGGEKAPPVREGHPVRVAVEWDDEPAPIGSAFSG